MSTPIKRERESDDYNSCRDVAPRLQESASSNARVQIKMNTNVQFVVKSNLLIFLQSHVNDARILFALLAFKLM